MADENKKKSFWEILAIVITAIAAVLGGLNGVAALITAMNSGKEGTAKTESVPPNQTAPTAQPSSVSSVNDEAVRRFKAEAEIAKAEAERAKTETAEAEVRAAELERKLAEIASAEVKAKKDAAAAKARAVELAKKLAESGKEAAAAEQLEEKPVEPKQGETMIDEATGMVLVYVHSGCFMMGQSHEEKKRLFAEVGLHDYNEDYLDEVPRHEVCVDSFWIGKYELTQAQWKNVMGDNPSRFKNDDNPVENISWGDIQKFITTLNKGIGKAYRLPTEAEWEYACRAGGFGRYCGGDNLDMLAWHGQNSVGTTHPVGEKEANAFGLYDMSGNVWEWCSDRYGRNYYASSPQNNPQGPDKVENRVLRGGSSFSRPLYCRAASRFGLPPTVKDDHFGFRLVLPVR